MTTDIKERLRDKAARMEAIDFVICAKLYRDAADYIEQLEGQLSAQTAEPAGLFERRSMFGPWIEVGRPTDKSVPLYTHPAKTEQPSLSDAEITDDQICEALFLTGVSPYGYPKSGDRFMRNDTKRIITAFRALLSAQRQDSDTPAISEQCVSSSGPIGCYRVRCHLGKVCAAIANGAPK